MKKEIILNGRKCVYIREIKKVKNINVRIKSDGIIYVSANKKIPVEIIEKFLAEKSDFIVNALMKYEIMSEHPNTAYYDENEIKTLILKLCENIYPYYKKYGIEYPEIKFRKMISQWGNCNSSKKRLTFNTNLMYAPFECIEYVVFHEYTHFLVQNHSRNFYDELAKVCPEWKERRNKLKQIYLEK